MPEAAWWGLVTLLGGIGGRALVTLIADSRWRRAGLWVTAIVGLCGAFGLALSLLLDGDPPWFLGLGLGVFALGMVAWFLLSWWRRHRRVREAVAELDAECHTHRVQNVDAIVTTFNDLVSAPTEKRRRELLSILKDLSGMFWQRFAKPAEKEEDQPLYRAHSVIITLCAESGEIPLDRLRDAVLLIAGLEGRKHFVVRGE